MNPCIRRATALAAILSLAAPARANTPPSVGDQWDFGNEDTPIAIELRAVDPDGGPLAFVIVSQPANGTLTGEPPHLVYTPNPDFNGIDSFLFMANDGTADGDVAAMFIEVIAVNDPPFFAGGPDQTARAGEGLKTVRGWAGGIGSGPPDEFLQKLRFEVETDRPGLFEVPPSVSPDGTLRYKPARNAEGTARARAVLRDDGPHSLMENGPDNRSGMYEFKIEVLPNPNGGQPVDELTAIHRKRVLAEDGMAAAPMETLAPPGLGPLAYTLLSAPAHGTLSGSTPDLVYTPDPDFSGRDQFSFNAAAGTIVSNTATVYLIVAEVNDPPSFDLGGQWAESPDSSAKTFPGWASNIKAGPPNEATQALRFEIGVDRADLFESLPVLDASGNLSFKTANAKHGVANLAVTLVDDGVGHNRSETKTMAIGAGNAKLEGPIPDGPLEPLPTPTGPGALAVTPTPTPTAAPAPSPTPETPEGN